MKNLLYLLPLLGVMSVTEDTCSTTIEVCDDIDNDGNGMTDEDLDDDLDGFSACATAPNPGDCNDADDQIYPGAVDSACDGIDQNCDGADALALWYRDADGDGYGASSETIIGCVPPAGYLARGEDCLDSDARYNPGAAESLTDLRDYNCDGAVSWKLSPTQGVTNQTLFSPEFGALSLTIPAGAVAGSSSITVTVALDDTPYPELPPGAGPVLRFAPDLTFTAPATVRYTLDPWLHPYLWQFECTDFVVTQLAEQTGEVQNDWLSPTHCDLTTGTVTVQQPHFSLWRVVGDGNSDGQPDPLVSFDPVYDSRDGELPDGKEIALVGAGEAAYRAWDFRRLGRPQRGYASAFAYTLVPDSGVTFMPDSRCGGKASPCVTEPKSKGDYRLNFIATHTLNTAQDATMLVWIPSEDPVMPYLEPPTCAPDDPGFYSEEELTALGFSRVKCELTDDEPECWDFNSDEIADPYECFRIRVAPDVRNVDDDGDGLTENQGDCNDTSTAIKPGTTEIAGDSVDQNCDGAEICYKDADNDGYRPDVTSTVASADSDCIDANEAVSTDPTTDCNDANADIKPGVSETCNGVDDNCNGSVDDGLTKLTWYRDSDGDGYGTAAATIEACSQPTGYVFDSEDCDDDDAAVHPTALEYPGNEKDDDCDGIESALVQVAGGERHTLARDDEGRVWAWGWNHNGQLGDGTTTQRNSPVHVPGLSGVVAVAGGGRRSHAVDSQGRVWAWGDNKFGQLGDGTTTQRNRPVQVLGLSGVTSVAAGEYHSLAVDSQGRVWAWGYNGDGQLGDGTTTQRNSPVQVPGLSGVKAVAGGGAHSLAVDDQGRVWAWGRNDTGQLGDGTTTRRYSPVQVQVQGLGGVKAVAGGGFHSLALDSQGRVWAWGRNYEGQIGDGSTITRTSPVQLTGLSGVIGVAAGSICSLAVDYLGLIRAWGENDTGQLGDGTITQRTSPVQVPGLSGVKAVVGGGYHSLALDAQGRVWAWGRNYEGQLGDPKTTARSSAEVIPGLGGIDFVASGTEHSIALDNLGRVWAWGSNFEGELGDGTTSSRSRPVLVSGLSGISSLAAGGAHSIALDSFGQVWAWGRNAEGQLGDGTGAQRLRPVPVPSLSGVVAVAAGYLHSLALDAQAQVWAWGDNIFGDIGDGTNTRRSSPVLVPGLISIVAVAAGVFHSLALDSEGCIWVWGYNEYGQVGDGTNTHRTKPVPVPGLCGVTALAGGYYYSLASDSQGRFWAWGANYSGQLGDGTSIQRASPVQVLGMSATMAVPSVAYHSLALDNVGRVWAWGSNDYGQLGDGTTTSRLTPIQVPGLTGVMAVAGGDSHSLAILADGTLASWGDNAYGQLGLGDTWSPQPVIWGP